MSEASVVEAKSQVPGSRVAMAPKPMVLVVDPDATSRSVLGVTLTREGFEVVATGSATQALAALRRGGAPDVVVLEADLGMDDDGLAFCAQLRAEAKTAKVPVVLLASAADPAAEAVASILGVEDYLVKPVFARDVSALVQVEYARRSGARVLTFTAAQLSPLHLLRALLSSPRSGHLLLARGRAELTFAGGKVRKVRFDGRTGLDAVVRALALTDGAYMLATAPVDDRPELRCGLKELVRDVFPRVSRWQAAVLRGVPLDATLVVDFPRLAQALPQLPDELNRVVQLFDGRRTARQVLLETPLNETLALEVVTRLYLMGVLTPASAAERETIVLKQAPRLFEPRPTEADELMRSLFEGTAEIRADEFASRYDGAWDSPPTGAQLLEGSAQDAGWEATPLSAAADQLTADLPDELARQIEAFGTTAQQEPKEATPAEQQLSRFSQGADAPEGPTIEEAFQQATGDAGASIPLEAPRGFVLTAGAQPTVLEGVGPERRSQTAAPTAGPERRKPTAGAQPPVQQAGPARRTQTSGTELTAPERRAQTAAPDAGPQQRSQAVPEAAEPKQQTAIDRVLAAKPAAAGVKPTVSLAAVAQDPSPTLPAASPDLQARIHTPELTPAVQPQGQPTAKLEEAFFDGDASAAEFEVPAAEALPEVAEALPEVAAPTRRSRAGWLLVLGLVAVAVSVIVEWTLVRPEPEAAPARAPVLVAPRPEVAPAPEPKVDPAEVDRLIAEGRKAYEEGRYQDAVAPLEGALDLDPTVVPAWLLLGLARYDSGNDPGAWEAVTMVQQLEPTNARVYLLKATMERDAKDLEQARRSVARYLELEPQGQFADEARALADGLR